MADQERVGVRPYLGSPGERSGQQAGRTLAGVVAGGEQRTVDPRAMRAWRAFLRAHSHVVRRLETELDVQHRLPLTFYDVLVQLAEAPEHRLRMNELADAVLLSRSGLTRLVDRLEGKGLVMRESCPSDARGTLAVLTPAGLDRLRSASGTHLRGVQTHVTSHFSPHELDVLAELLGRLAPPDRVSAGGSSGRAGEWA